MDLVHGRSGRTCEEGGVSRSIRRDRVAVGHVTPPTSTRERKAPLGLGWDSGVGTTVGRRDSSLDPFPRAGRSGPRNRSRALALRPSQFPGISESIGICLASLIDDPGARHRHQHRGVE
ncbi:hypothetical protein ZWY2020_007313 [Hordeum vulgare]|nr:hypothetical protein ZWY2020_007313 [Hordeum vulgare]